MRRMGLMVLLVGLLAPACGGGLTEATPQAITDRAVQTTLADLPTATLIPIPTVVPTPTVVPAPAVRFDGCTGTGTVQFAHSPMGLEEIKYLIPYGLMAGGHVTPIDHMYFEPLDRSLGRDVYEVRAVQDGVIYKMQPRDVNVDTGQAKQREWRLDIAHTCSFVSYLDLLTSVDPALEAEWAKTEGGRAGQGWYGIPIKAGQLIGRIGAQTLDFGVYDYNVVLPGYIVPSHYDYEPWKVHTVDPFPYFPTAIRDSLLAKMLRKAEPRAGKIDHDVDGRAVGNWFQQGTNWYQGLVQQKYWDGHLALVPDTYDPTAWRFSIGNFGGNAKQLGIKGNGPAPSGIGVESGLIRYELVLYDYYAANEPNRTGIVKMRPTDDIRSRDMGSVQGIALIQMTGPRTLKCEVFPGKTAAEVTGFTSAAKTYER
ncbi:MAG: hypothetical protein DWG81_02600 [Chloroflexi bacterium]|nr:hypothetical protein [Chloroflexota bacterium]